MGTGCDGRKLLTNSGVSAVLKSGESLIFYARPGGLELRLELSTKANQGSRGTP
jgi:hypothetical protein